MIEVDSRGLLSYQVPACSALLRTLQRTGAALDGSDMGTGKTFTATAVARSLDLPTLVICPQISITSWHRAATALGTAFDVLNYEMVRQGTTPYGRWENPKPDKMPSFLECTECQLKVELDKPFRCPHQHLGIHCVRERKEEHNYGKFYWHEGIRFLIFDEVHRCGGTDSLNADMLIAAKRQGIPTLVLSATVADSPMNLRALGYLLGLHGLIGDNSFYRWAMRNGCRKSPFGGFQFMGSEEVRREKMLRLHSQIYPEHGYRIKISDLPPGTFPDCQIVAELYDLKEKDRIDELYAEMDEALADLNERRMMDADLEHPLTKALRAKQQIELLKVPIFEELARAGVEAGRTVGLFVNFTQTIDELCKRLKTKCRIDGSQRGAKGQAERQNWIDRLQADQERVMVLNNQAGGVSISLQDITGKHPRLGLVSLPNSASMFRQLCGRFPRATGKSPSLYRAILVAGTVEVRQHTLLAAKLNQLDAINDGDMWASNLPLKKHSLDDLTAAERMV